MNIKLVALVLLLDLGLVFSLAYFHAEAYPIIQENTVAAESSGAMRATTLANGGNGTESTNKAATGKEQVVSTRVWNKSLFIKDLMLGFAAMCIINGLLVVVIRRMGASEILED